VQHDARVQRHEAFGRRQQGVDVGLADLGVLDDHLAEDDEET